MFVSGRDGFPDLWRVGIDPKTGKKAGKARRLTSALGVSEFTLGPDGRKLLAVKAKNQSRLWSFSMKPKRLTDLAAGKPLTAGDFYDWSPSLMPGGRSILFASNRRGTDDIWKLRLGSAHPVRLTTGPGRKYQPRMSPDGRWIVLGLIDERGGYLHLMRPDGSDLHLLEPKLAEKFSTVYNADWSPDSSRLAAAFAARDKGGFLGIAHLDRETGTARQIKLFNMPGAMGGRPRWSRDGRFLACEAITEGSWDLWIAAADGSKPRRLTSGPGNERNPVWSHDGKVLYFIKDNRSIWQLPMAASGKPAGPQRLWAQFPKTRIEDDGLAISEDKAIIALIEEASDLWMVEFKD
jgi:Tol biopolymer transport system component